MLAINLLNESMNSGTNGYGAQINFPESRTPRRHWHTRLSPEWAPEGAELGGSPLRTRIHASVSGPPRSDVTSAPAAHPGGGAAEAEQKQPRSFSGPGSGSAEVQAWEVLAVHRSREASGWPGESGRRRPSRTADSPGAARSAVRVTRAACAGRGAGGAALVPLRLCRGRGAAPGRGPPGPLSDAAAEEGVAARAERDPGAERVRWASGGR